MSATARTMWGFTVGDDVEVRTRFAELQGVEGLRDLTDERYEWHRAIVAVIARDGTMFLRLKRTVGNLHRVNNPRLVRHWAPPSTPDEIERFLNG